MTKKLRRAHGEGSLYQRLDGTWAAVLSGVDPVTNKRTRTFFYAPNKNSAIAKLKAAKEARDAGVEVTDDTLGHFLINKWLPHISARVSSASLEVYTRVVNIHIVPHLGDTHLQKVTASQIDGLAAKIKNAGGSAARFNHAREIIYRALEQARKWKLIRDNPAEDVELLPWKRREAKPWTEEEVRTFLRTVSEENHRFANLFLLALTSGLRLGEIVALMWNDIDFERRILTVSRQALNKQGSVGDPKSKSSVRSLSLSPTCISILEKQKALLQGDAARSSSPYVFPGPSGEAMVKNAVAKAFRKFLRKSGLRTIRFHDMRHTNATLLLANGADVKTVQGRLGHSSASITLNTYAKFTKSADEKAAKIIGGVVGLLPT